MLSWIREKFGTVVIGGIIAFITFVFVFYGVFSPKATRGLHEGAVAGTVNGDPISIGEFNRTLNQRMEYFKSIAGDSLTEEQMKTFGIRKGVFQQLVSQKLLLQQAVKKGLVAADGEVKDTIQEISAFKKDGKFNLAQYKEVLEANQQTPGSYERLVRESLSSQQWEDYFQDQVFVTEEEIKREFLVTQDKRNIKYVLLGGEGTVKKDEPAEEALKKNEKLAEQVIPLLKKDKASDAKLNALLKASSSQVKSTGLINRRSASIPGFGEAKDVLSDAFDKAPGVKKYTWANRVLVALVSESEKPDLAKFANERDSLVRRISARKSRDLFEKWMNQVTQQAKVDPNLSVVGEE